MGPDSSNTGARSTASKVDTARHVSPYGFVVNFKRLIWSVVEATAFRWTWPTWYRYRGWLLRLFGADIHPTARLRRSCRFTCPWNLAVGANSASGDRAIFYSLGPISIGQRVTISQGCHLCAGSHDYTDPVAMPLLRPSISIGNDAWIATDAFVGPGISIGEGAILGARGCAFKDLDSWVIYGGNPAKKIARRDPRRAPAPTSLHKP